MKELVFIILISSIISYLVFPLNKEYKEISSSDNQTTIIKKLDYCKYYITINIGSEKVNVNAYITQANSEFFIGGQNIKNNKYNELSSESYNCTNKEIIYNDYGVYIEGVLSTENFYIKNGNNEIQLVNNLDFILGTKPKYEDNTIHGEIGLHLPYNKPVSYYNFIFCLKRANTTNSYNWYFDFDNFSKGEGKMVVDALPHDLHEKYKENNFAKISAINKKYTFNWGIIFSSIYYDSSNPTILLNYFEANIEFDKGLISAPMEVSVSLESLFFEKYISDKLCFKDTFNVYKDVFFYCKNSKKINIDEFKSIYFKSKDLEIIFELDYKDLFYYVNDYIIFLITFKENSKIWNLGDIFYKKYYLVFNQESKTIGYYQGLEVIRKNKGKSFKITFVHIMLILTFISIWVVGVIIYIKKGKPRKNRANELDDYNYEYESKEENNSEGKKDNLLIN